MLRKTLWFLFALFAIVIGLYPMIYFIVDAKIGILQSKTDELLASTLWNIGFFGHITFGGLALLVGWSQFSSKLRSRKMRLHRNLGKFYIIAVLISGICGVFIGFYATGGLIAQLGFISLGVIWLSTTFIAYNHIRNGDTVKHEHFMIFSYAACFAAVTLRIWLPLLTVLFSDFMPAYQLVAWLCWVPNIIIAYLIVRSKKRFIGSMA